MRLALTGYYSGRARGGSSGGGDDDDESVEGKRYPTAIAETRCGEGGGPLEGLKRATFWTSKLVVKKFFF